MTSVRSIQPKKNLPFYFYVFWSIFFSIFSSSQSLYASEVSSNQTSKFYECVDAHKKWDFQKRQCLPGRKWIEAPQELLDKLDRTLTDSEKASAIQAIGIDSPKTLSRSQKPQAIIMIGAGGAGKSFLSQALSEWIDGFKHENYILFDGDILRQYHQGFLEATQDTQIGYTNAWPTIKPRIFETKSQLIDQILNEKRNIIVPTAIEGQKYFELLKSYGYEISVIGIFVDYKNAFYRGKNRAEWTGRIYLGKPSEWDTGVKDMYALAKNPEVKSSLIVDNNDIDDIKVIFERNWRYPKAIEQAHFMTCVSDNKKWDSYTRRCLPGRIWSTATEEELKSIKRPLTEDELLLAKEKMNLLSASTLAKNEAPKAIIMIGAPGSGKSTLSKKLSIWFPGFDINNYVQFDGDILREFHDGLQSSIQDQTLGYENGWPALKPNIAKAKKELLKELIQDKKNVIIPTGLHGEKYYKKLVKHGYDISIVGVFVDEQTSYFRGKNRAQWTGRVYTGTPKHWKQSYKDMYKLAQNSKVKRAFIIDNTDYNHPKMLFYK